MSVDTAKIKLTVLDVDGTLTDGGIYILESGEQFKKFNAKDGLGVQRAVQQGYVIGIISHSKSSGAVLKRAEMMGVQKSYVGQLPKLEVLRSWCKELGLRLDEVAYVGDDLNDLEIIEAVGLAACPADAMPRIIESCDVVLTKKGGEGCVREFLDLYFLRN